MAIKIQTTSVNKELVFKLRLFAILRCITNNNSKLLFLAFSSSASRRVLLLFTVSPSFLISFVCNNFVKTRTRLCTLQQRIVYTVFFSLVAQTELNVAKDFDKLKREPSESTFIKFHTPSQSDTHTRSVARTHASAKSNQRDVQQQKWIRQL